LFCCEALGYNRPSELEEKFVRLILLRHGQTLWNREGRVQGFTDVELTEVGEEQSQRVALYLQGEALEAVYSSPLRRALYMAQRIALPRRIPVRTHPGLMELNQGGLEGLTYQEIANRHPVFIEQWKKAPASAQIPDGESLESLQERAWRAMEEIVREHPQGSVAVVSHNLVNRVTLCKLLQMDLNLYRIIRQDEAALNIIEFTNGQTSLITLNQTFHLSSHRE